MKEIKLDNDLATSFISFIAEYSNSVPNDTELSKFINSKIVEKDIFFSLKQGLITKNEAIDLIIGHVFTKYAKGLSIKTDKHIELEKVRFKVETFVDNNT